MRALKSNLVVSMVLVICSMTSSGCGSKSSDDNKQDGAVVNGGGSGNTGSSGSGGGGSSNVGGSGGSNAGSGGDGSIDGGTGSGGAGSIDAPPAVAELAEKLAGGVCGALLDCVGPSRLATLVGGEDCATRVKLEFLAGEFSYLQESIDAKRVKINDGSLDACVSGIKAMGCKVQTDSFPADCETLVEGSVKLGDACTISSDCEGTAFCKMQTCPAVCSALLAAGDSCKKDEECGDDLVCNAGMCQKPSKQNEACVGTSGKVCAFGYSCWNGTDTTDGTCHSNAETLAGAKDDTCEPGGVLCMEGLSCVFDGVSQFHCEEKVGSGGNCHRGLPGQCPAGEFCNTATQGSVTEMGTCKTLPGDGEDCVQPGGACQAGLVCILETGTTTICRPIHDNGGSCKMDAACRSGYCDAAVCKPPPVCK